MAQVKDPSELGLSVVVRGNGPNDFMKALRKFKRKVNESGIMQDYKDRQYYQKPSEKDVWLRNRQFVGNNVLCKKNVTTINRL